MAFEVSEMLFFTLLLATPLVVAFCPSGTVFNGDFNKCYKFETEQLGYLSAEQKCISLGGHLTSIGNTFEDSFLQSSAMQNFGSASGFWIGANLLMSTEWSWTDNTQFSYTQWAAGEPGGGYECAYEKIQDGTWSASLCNVAKSFICSFPVNSTARPDYCETGWTFFEHSDSCYKVFFGGTFDEAETLCTYHNAHLASIHNQMENDFVANISKTNEKQSWDNQVWIGLKKDTWNDIYWTDRTPVDFENWGPGQPNKPSEKCIQLCSDEISNWGNNGYKSKWNDISCTDNMRALVCKKPALHQNNL